MSFLECSTSSSLADIGAMTSIHKRSISDSFPNKSKHGKDRLEHSQRVKLDKGRAKKCLMAKKNHLPNTQIQVSLKDEICQLEKKLEDQVCVRGAFEQALGYRSSSDIPNQAASIPKPAKELIREIAVLEYEVSHLEQYLLSLYRRAFDQQISCPSPLRNDKTLKPSLITPRGKYLETCRADISLKSNTIGFFQEEEFVDSGVQHCHSSIVGDEELENLKEAVMNGDDGGDTKGKFDPEKL